MSSSPDPPVWGCRVQRLRPYARVHYVVIDGNRVQSVGMRVLGVKGFGICG